VVAAAAGCGAWVVLGGVAGAVAAPVVAVVALVVLQRAEPGAVRREREEAARELPHLVALLGAALRSGAGPLDGLAAAAAALPGPAARRVAPVIAAGRFGGTWDRLDEVAQDEVLAPLARTLVRAERSGSSVVDAVEDLADELEREAGAAAEDAARRVGVAAAVPLGLCLLPAFLLIGIVPTVAALLAEVTR
jgi:pilus assembly protein TadC